MALHSAPRDDLISHRRCRLRRVARRESNSRGTNTARYQTQSRPAALRWLPLPYSYRKAHDDIWPDMVAALKNGGAHNYSIALHPGTLQLFGFVEVRARRTRGGG